MAELDKQEARRREARTALGGEKIAEREKIEEKRRREAILAMEGEKHRERRQRTEAENIARQNAAQAKIRKAAEAEAAAQAATARVAAERARAEEATLEQATNRKNKIEQSEELTEKLKGSSTKLSGFRTIKTDMARAVRERGLSLSKIASLSNERGDDKDSRLGSPHHSRWLFWLLTVVILGTGAYFGWRWWQTPAPAEPINIISIADNPIMRADLSRPINLTGVDSVNQVREAVTLAIEQSDEQNGLINIALIKNGQPISFREFQTALGLNLPDNLTRHLRDSFLFGTYDNGEIRSPFLILKTSFFDQAWSAMFDWERYMASDLAPLMASVNDNKATWLDRVIHNKDTRELVNEAGNPLILYGFIDEETILITRDENTFIRVFERLIDQS